MLTTARPVHPGGILREESLEPLGLSAIGVPRTRVERVRDEATSVTANIALRFAADISPRTGLPHGPVAA